MWHIDRFRKDSPGRLNPVKNDYTGQVKLFEQKFYAEQYAKLSCFTDFKSGTAYVIRGSAGNGR